MDKFANQKDLKMVTSYKEKNIDYPTNEELSTLARNAIVSFPIVVGLPIAILKPDRNIFTYTYGKANLDTDSSLSNDTKMAIASNTKPLIIALALILLDENPEHFPGGLKTKMTEIKDINNNLLFLNDAKILLPNNHYIRLSKNSLIPDLSKITLHHLLYKSSGCFDVFSEVNLSNTFYISDHCQNIFNKILSPSQYNKSKKILTALETLKKYGLIKKANPNPIKPTQSHNTDAFLLSIILEKVSGKTLNQLLFEKLLKPIDLELESIHFIDKVTSHSDKTSARRYALLNTDNEIHQAIKDKKTYKIIDDDFALSLSATHLEKLGQKIRQFVYHQQENEFIRPVLDIVDSNGEEFDNIPGAAGIVAKPKAYIQIFQALASGTLLNQKQQKQFNDSFIPIPEFSTSDHTTSIGYGSTHQQRWLTSSKKPLILSHTGFIIGSQSIISYDYRSSTTIMIAINSTGNWRELPCFHVVHTPHFDSIAMMKLNNDYMKLFRII